MAGEKLRQEVGALVQQGYAMGGRGAATIVLALASLMEAHPDPAFEFMWTDAENLFDLELEITNPRSGVIKVRLLNTTKPMETEHDQNRPRTESRSASGDSGFSHTSASSHEEKPSVVDIDASGNDTDAWQPMPMSLDFPMFDGEDKDL